jgi:hypothetical protein
LGWVGLVNGTDSTGGVSQAFNSNRQGSRLGGRSPNRWWNCVQTDINIAKLHFGKTGKKNRADWEKYIEEVRVSIGL